MFKFRILFLMLLVVIPVSAFTQTSRTKTEKGKVDVSGEWRISYYFNGTYSGYTDIRLKQNSRKLTAHSRSSVGVMEGQWVEFEAKLAGDKITLDLSGQRNTAIYRGTVGRNIMKGTIDFGGGDSTRGTWTAKRL